MTSEALVRRAIGQEGATVLCDIVRGAWQDYVDEDISREHVTTIRNIVWDYMAKRARVSLVPMDGVDEVEILDRPMFSVRGLLLLRAKFHTRESLTRNYPTKTQKAVEASGKLFGQPDLSVVSFGYTLDAAEADVDQVVMTAPNEEWKIDLEAMANGATQPVTSLLTGMEEDLSWIEPIRRLGSA